jgi:hypothetical protein
MTGLPIDRRGMLAVLGGGGAAVAALSPKAMASKIDGQRWLALSVPQPWRPEALSAALASAARLDVQAVVIEAAGLEAAATLALLRAAIPAGAALGLMVHVNLGDLAARLAGPQIVFEGPTFARTPYERLSDPRAEALQDRLRGPLRLDGLEGVQFNHAGARDLEEAALIADYVVAPARLRGKVVTARLTQDATIPPAWSLDGAFAARSAPVSSADAWRMAILHQAIA